jgi:cupin 2 domain-containing protein
MKRSLFDDIPVELPDELIEVIAQSGDVRIERIISRGHSSPDDFWYDQETNEFVLLLKGRAGLVFEGKNEVIIMEAGDCVEIKSHVRHRVEWTAANEDTIWLAVHYK